jgi:hypothetical protein
VGNECEDGERGTREEDDDKTRTSVAKKESRWTQERESGPGSVVLYI